MLNKRAAIYTRFSSTQQRPESCEAQEHACREFARSKGYDVFAVYEDEAESARTDDRPAFQRMLADSTKKLFTVLLCHKLDRFARDAYSYAVNKRLLNKQGVTIEYAAQHFDASPEGVLMESIIAGFAEYYSSNLAKETRKGLDQNARSGKSCGGKLPLGYLRTEAGLIEVDESTATIIRGIFKDKETMSCEAVAKKYRKPISTIKTILHNKKYRGIGVFGLRSKISGAPTVEFSFPAIIEEELA